MPLNRPPWHLPCSRCFCGDEGTSSAGGVRAVRAEPPLPRESAATLGPYKAQTQLPPRSLRPAGRGTRPVAPPQQLGSR